MSDNMKSPTERNEQRKRLVALIGKFCNIKRSDSAILGGQYRKLIDVGETHLIFEGDPKAGGGYQIECEELDGIQEVQYRDEKYIQGPFR